MSDFLNNMELITGTVKEVDEITKKSSLKQVEENVKISNRKEVIRIIKDLQSFLFPDYYTRSEESENVLSQTELLLNIYNRLKKEINGACEFNKTILSADAATLTEEFISRLPFVKKLLLKDVDALFEGDPAAKCREEVLICYPGFYAISIYRIAHELYELNIPLIPRIMTEFAHEKTGIDIHAGAKIGEYFFIDHGTGIVIGETTTIGKNVKIYQGVTLGAKSFKVDHDGNPIKNIKRHPDIGDNVVIYANATILGGDTKIGNNCVIGGNVWLTKSVEDNKTVYYTGD